ncbi:hypothetical protein [Paenibacillus sp.]|uniref:hypothetical protein n=1 Tax=Paenibacillus sp. TaxID=58172 RepID=UPI002D47EB35|nr:hypothetical protein [Paenibacillus sp.]HZG88371.1 hypothetical protein [Paenibacillus sp.]
MTQDTNRNEAPRGDVRFEAPPARLVAEREDDADIEQENERLKAERPYPHSCGGV